jgi:N-acyl-D-aspartate/D-glutamate deacylase
MTKTWPSSSGGCKVEQILVEVTTPTNTHCSFSQWMLRSGGTRPCPPRAGMASQLHVVMSNCGVTFAPCWRDDHDFLMIECECETFPLVLMHRPAWLAG